jgi:hypothetical protein
MTVKYKQNKNVKFGNRDGGTTNPVGLHAKIGEDDGRGWRADMTQVLRSSTEQPSPRTDRISSDYLERVAQVDN